MTVKKTTTPHKGARPVTIVGQARNGFGTRLSHRVVCVRCKQADHIAIKPGPKKNSLCRACAEEVLYKYEQGKVISEQKIEFSCSRCHMSFLASLALTKKDGDILCPDCYRGFEVWRGKLHQEQTSSQKKTVLKRGMTAIRIRAYEPISAN